MQGVDSAAVDRAVAFAGHHLEGHQTMQSIGVVDGAELEIVE